MLSKINYNIWITVVIFTAITLVGGFPTTNSELEEKADEKTLPNGTVVGKYAYLDKEGNPIQVKYYADESSYGVELNKIKVVPSKMDTIATTTLPEATKTKDNEKSGHSDSQYDFFEAIKYPSQKSDKVIEPLDFLNKETTKSGHQKNKYKNPEYEIYMQNDVGSPNKHCSADNEKVRVYNYGKHTRKVRRLNFDQKEPKFCVKY